jgi:hypothetical protein
MLLGSLLLPQNLKIFLTGVMWYIRIHNKKKVLLGSTIILLKKGSWYILQFAITNFVSKKLKIIP